MGDWFDAVSVHDVRREESRELADRVIARLVSAGIIDAKCDAESILGGSEGYRPGPQLPLLYEVAEMERLPWDVLANGMEVCARPWVNVYAFCFFHGLTCPNCHHHIVPEEEDAMKSIYEAVGLFLSGKPVQEVRCFHCLQSTNASEWKSEPQLHFAQLAFQFWNWPPLTSSSWKVDIPGIIAETTEHIVSVGSYKL